MDRELDPRMLEMLVCPLTKTRLILSVNKTELISRAARMAFPIRKGVPLLTIDEARNISEERSGSGIGRWRRVVRRLGRKAANRPDNLIPARLHLSQCPPSDRARALDRFRACSGPVMRIDQIRNRKQVSPDAPGPAQPQLGTATQ